MLNLARYACHGGQPLQGEHDEGHAVSPDIFCGMELTQCDMAPMAPIVLVTTGLALHVA